MRGDVNEPERKLLELIVDMFNEGIKLGKQEGELPPDTPDVIIENFTRRKIYTPFPCLLTSD
jgi:hypothetical protein